MDFSNTEYVRSTTKIMVLALLTEKQRMYSYEITVAIRERTNGEFILTFGSLYKVLYKLEKEGILRTESELVDGRLRKHYFLALTGRQSVRQKQVDFTHFIQLMNQLFHDPITLTTRAMQHNISFFFVTTLTPQKNSRIRQYLRHIGTRAIFLDELEDYLVCQTEELMSSGFSFDDTQAIIEQETTSSTVRQLYQSLVRQRESHRTQSWQNPYRSKRPVNIARNLIRPLRYALIIGAVLYAVLISFLFARKGITTTVELFATLLCPLLLFLFIFLLRTTYLRS